ncbi:hypothetical protein ACFXC8_43355 [Streptomyces sp. NPDC059441]|uniref:hypothetical protein n=1 Tax=Streptomyces sp. NPDC059441 TaxID=3346829 RepID=UPI0036A6C927
MLRPLIMITLHFPDSPDASNCLATASGHSFDAVLADAEESDADMSLSPAGAF